ncbi:MAG: hypothetical protein ACREJC_01140 [Tepidisphaeraceae bacterium]
MSPIRVREILAEQPFRPFTVHTGDGGAVRVLSREMAWLLPGGRTLMVATGRKIGDDDELVTIDVFLITKITRPTTRRRKAG